MKGLAQPELSKFGPESHVSGRPSARWQIEPHVTSKILMYENERCELMRILFVTTKELEMILVFILLWHRFEFLERSMKSELLVLNDMAKLLGSETTRLIPIYEPSLVTKPTHAALILELVNKAPRLARLFRIGDDTIRRGLKTLVQNTVWHPGKIVHDEFQIEILDVNDPISNDFNNNTPNQNVLAPRALDYYTTFWQDKLAEIVAIFVEGKSGAVGIRGAIGLRHGNQPINKVPNKECIGADKNLENTDSDLAAHETVNR